MTVDDILKHYRETLDKIRQIRDTFGDDRCVFDWHELFRMLPEGYTPPSQDIPVQLKDCERFLKCKAEGTEYIPPPRWVSGIPDRVGLWLIESPGGWLYTLTHYEGDCIDGANIAKSFGPIPKM